jgi:hypothetical protein
MNIHSQKRQNDIVGGDNRPRAHVVRPRGGTLCVGVPKGGPPTTSTSPTTWAEANKVKPPTSRTQFQLTLECQPNVSDSDSVRGLRILLKRMLRSYGLKCVGMVQLDRSKLTADEAT